MIICAPMISQMVAEGAVREELGLSRGGFHREFVRRRHLVADRLAAIPKLQWTPTGGGFFAFARVAGCSRLHRTRRASPRGRARRRRSPAPRSGRAARAVCACHSAQSLARVSSRGSTAWRTISPAEAEAERSCLSGRPTPHHAPRHPFAQPESGLVVVSVLSLALGLGVNLAMFSAIEAIFFYEPTLADPSRVYTVQPGNSNQFSYLNYRDLRDSRIVETAAGSRARHAEPCGQEPRPERVGGPRCHRPTSSSSSGSRWRSAGTFTEAEAAPERQPRVAVAQRFLLATAIHRGRECRSAGELTHQRRTLRRHRRAPRQLPHR